MSKIKGRAYCKTCGVSGPPWSHKPSPLDPEGTGDPGHRLTPNNVDGEQKVMTTPQQSGEEELKAFINGWLVEVAFGVYDREDLPKLADKMLAEFATKHLAKARLEAKIEVLREVVQNPNRKSYFLELFNNALKEKKRLAQLASMEKTG